MFTSTLVTLLTYLFPLTGLGLMMSASQTFTYAYGPPAHPFKGDSIIIIYNITPLELFDFVLESSCESPEDGVACLLGQPPLVQIHLAGVTLHKIWSPWNPGSPCSRHGSSQHRWTSHTIGQRSIQEEQRVLEEEATWWFKEKEKVPLLRTVTLGIKKERSVEHKGEAFVENNWVEHLLIFKHNRNTLMPTHLFFSKDRMKAIFSFPYALFSWETFISRVGQLIHRSYVRLLKILSTIYNFLRDTMRGGRARCSPTTVIPDYANAQSLLQVRKAYFWQQILTWWLHLFKRIKHSLIAIYIWHPLIKLYLHIGLITTLSVDFNPTID